jgi:hypothetical protein
MTILTPKAVVDSLVSAFSLRYLHREIKMQNRLSPIHETKDKTLSSVTLDAV